MGKSSPPEVTSRALRWRGVRARLVVRATLGEMQRGGVLDRTTGRKTVDVTEHSISDIETWNPPLTKSEYE